jgi:hypothetical protein
MRLGHPDYPEGSSRTLIQDYHVTATGIHTALAQMFERKVEPPAMESPADIPGDWFSGPF